MSKTMKTLLMVLCAIALVVCSVLGTLAYLTSIDKATNTFTAGDVKTSVDEDDPDSTDPDDRVPENEYELIPGKNYDKDPIVHIEGEDCYTFVTVQNSLAAIEDPNADSIAKQMADNGWALLKDGTEVVTVDGLPVWYFCSADGENSGVTVSEAGVLTVGDGIVDVTVFTNFTIGGEVDNETLKQYVTTYTTKYYDEDGNEVTDEEAIDNGEYTKEETTVDVATTIQVTSYTVQAEGFSTALDAWNAAFVD